MILVRRGRLRVAADGLRQAGTAGGAQVVKARSSRIRELPPLPMPRRTSASRKCLANRCSQRVEPPAVFCRNHWDQLPEALREGLQRAIIRGQHAEAVTLLTDANRNLGNHYMRRRS
jgi:hypothetical protein